MCVHRERLTFLVNLNVHALARDWTAPQSMSTMEKAVIQGHLVSLLPLDIIDFKAQTFQDSCCKAWMIKQWISISAPIAANTGKWTTCYVQGVTAGMGSVLCHTDSKSRGWLVQGPCFPQSLHSFLSTPLSRLPPVTGYSENCLVSCQKCVNIRQNWWISTGAHMAKLDCYLWP